MQRNFINVIIKLFIVLCIFFISDVLVLSQNDVMMQAFYWDVPVDDLNKNGAWWDTLTFKADDLKEAGFTALWVPSPSKGNWGIWDMGYGIYDHYDLGNYYQKGSRETRFGSRLELEKMIAAMHDMTNGAQRIDLYADIILNHIYGSDDNLESNPAVKRYVFDEAFRHNKQFVPYPANEITWRLSNAKAGNYHIKIKSYNQDYSKLIGERGYDFQIDYAGTGFSYQHIWEMEPNDGMGQYNIFPGSGFTVRGFAHYKNDVDEYLVKLDADADVILKLTARETDGSTWNWGDQTQGFYPFEIWYNRENLAPSRLEAYTNTKITYSLHNGRGEKNYSWDYSHFHPSDEHDWLGDWGSDDEIISNTKGYGNDLNTFSETVQERMNDWGKWLVEEVGFDGFRLDFVRGFQELYAASWVNNLPEIDGNQRFVVGEYWGSGSRIQKWVNKMAELGANVNCFDFPLKATLTDLCNGNAGFDMRKLHNAGLVRDNLGSNLPGTYVVTFIDNHDTGKEHDQWVTKDWHMGYAYILTHEGRPCVFYPHFFGVTLKDFSNNNKEVEIPSLLQQEIRKLMFIRKTYLDGTIAVLSQLGNPFPENDVSDVYVARRQGNGSKKGAIIVINNANTTKGLWVDTTPTGWDDFSNCVLVNAFDETQFSRVDNNGRVWVEAPPRGYAIYVLNDEYVKCDLL